jgi:hypothetical protein
MSDEENKYVGQLDLTTKEVSPGEVDPLDGQPPNLVWDSMDFSHVPPEAVENAISTFFEILAHHARKEGILNPVASLYYERLRWNWKLRAKVYPNP